MNFIIMTGYLDQANPEILDKLKKDHPTSLDIFSSSMEFGSTNDDANVLNEENASAKMDLINATAKQLKEDIKTLLLAMKVQMKLVHRIRLTNGIVTALTGAIGAGMVLLVKNYSWTNEQIAFILALVTMISGLLSLFAENFERTPIGVKFAGFDEMSELINSLAEIEKILIKISQIKIIPWTNTQLTESVNFLNDVSIKVVKLKYLSPN